MIEVESQPARIGPGPLFELATDSERRERLYGVVRTFCHDVRNQLNSLNVGLYLARRQSRGRRHRQWADVEASCQRCEQVIDRLQTICKPLEIMVVQADLGLLIAERRPSWVDWLSAAGLDFAIDPPPRPLVVPFDPVRLGQGLDALVAWRAETAEPGSSVECAWSSTGGWACWEWREAGARPPTLQATGLALPLLARVIAAHGGHVEVSSEFVVRAHWPVASRS